jgi:hypothetical protein
MIKRRGLFLTLVILLLIAGLFAFRLLNPNHTDAAAPESAPVEDEPGFRQWFWHIRAPDLIVQVILIFAGTLGIAAVLPLEDEDD